MTLTKKMALGILSLLMMVFIGTYLITFNNERNYFMQQMESNAQDTATSLGLSLSQALANKDKAMMLAMVQAVFDRGYFARIEVKDLQGNLLVSRYELQQNRKIPQWFINLIHWPVPVQSSIVMNGWQQVGHVFVTSDSSYALNALWKNAKELVYWYLLFAFLSLVIGYLCIQWLLKPLKRMTRQAYAICEREFPVETHIPKTKELKLVTLAMNHMVIRVKNLFQDQLQKMQTLRELSYQDPLTGLCNRRYFLQQLTTLLSHDEEFVPGFILFIAIDGLERLNQEQGFQQGDQLVEKIAKSCVDYWSAMPGLTIARISGSNFALIVKESDSELFMRHCVEFNTILQQEASHETFCEIFMAVTAYQLHQASNALLIELDKVLKDARSQPEKLSFSPNLHDKDKPLITDDMIRQALNSSALCLFGQIVTDEKRNFHHEIFVRLDHDGQQLSAGYFMPVAEKAGLAGLIDQMVLDQVLDAGLLTEPLALNVTEETIINTQNQTAYLAKLEKLAPQLLNHIHLEFNEAIVLKHFSAVAAFVKALKKLSVQVGIDQVGLHFSPMHYLNELPVNYLKLHGSLIHHIDENQNKQFFLHYFNEMAKTLDIHVIATQIETEKQWSALKNLGIIWGQGKYLYPVKAVFSKTSNK